jgi:hypothetical protein
MRRGASWLWSACGLALVLTALLAPAADAAGWDASTTVRYTDLNPDAGVVDPQFSWDAIPRAAKYEVEVNSSSDWSVGARVCCDDKAIGTSMSPLKLLPNNTYYWRMRALDAAGNAGQWNVWCGNDVFPCSTPAAFEKTFDDVTPTIPRLRVRDSAGDAPPPAGASGLPSTSAPVVAWDPVPGASSYELRVAPWDASGGFCNWTASSTPSAHTFTTATTAWTPLAAASNSVSPVGNAFLSVASDSGWGLRDGTSYCVRVRARSDRDAKSAEIVSDWTQIGGLGSAAFTYQAPSLPPCAAAATPASAYHDEPQTGTATPRMPLFTWDRVPGACAYYVVVAKDPAFTKVVDVALTNSPAYAPRTSFAPTTYTDETTSYYWVVMPSVSPNGDGVSTQPQEDNPQPFNKRSVPPSLIAPVAGAGVTGEPSFRWSAAEGAREYRIQVDDDQTFGSPATDVVTDSTAYTSTTRYPADTTLYWRVRADDENKIGLSWSDTGTFRALPPDTFIHSGPAMSGSTVSFTFGSDVSDAAFKCKLDGPGTKLGTYAPCFSPATYGPLADGAYTFSVVAADLAGNADATPDTRTFTVDTKAPDTSIATAPPTATSSRTAAFTFGSTEAASSFECKLDGPGAATGVWGACSSPDAYDDLADGGYTFSVRATDAAGNTDATPAAARFTVDTQAPDTVISAGPDTVASSGAASFAFAASEPGAKFQCRLDGPGTTVGRWAGCASPATYRPSTEGVYSLSVRATDAAGNTDATPATWVFTVTAAPSTPSLPIADSPVSIAPVTIKRLGAPTFPVPRSPVPVRAGAAHLRFTCTTGDGCTAATFVIQGNRPRFRLTLTLEALPTGSRSVTVRFSHAVQRSLRRAGRRGLKVTVARAGAATTASARLVARR